MPLTGAQPRIDFVFGQTAGEDPRTSQSPLRNGSILSPYAPVQNGGSTSPKTPNRMGRSQHMAQIRSLGLLHDLQDYIASVESLAAEQRRELEKMRDEKREMERFLAKSEALQLERGHTVDFSSSEVADLPPRLRAVVEDNRGMREIIRKYKTRTGTLEHTVTQQQNQVLALAEANERLKQQIAECSRTPAEAEREDALKRQLELKARQAENLEHSLGVLRSKLDTDSKTYRHNLSAAAREKDALKRQLATTQRNLEDREKEVRHLQLELRKTRRAAAPTRHSVAAGTYQHPHAAASGTEDDEAGAASDSGPAFAPTPPPASPRAGTPPVVLLRQPSQPPAPARASSAGATATAPPDEPEERIRIMLIVVREEVQVPVPMHVSVPVAAGGTPGTPSGSRRGPPEELQALPRPSEGYGAEDSGAGQEEPGGGDEAGEGYGGGGGGSGGQEEPSAPGEELSVSGLQQGDEGEGGEGGGEGGEVDGEWPAGAEGGNQEGRDGLGTPGGGEGATGDGDGGRAPSAPQAVPYARTAARAGRSGGSPGSRGQSQGSQPPARKASTVGGSGPPGSRGSPSRGSVASRK